MHLYDIKAGFDGAFCSRNLVREPSDFVLSEDGRVAQDMNWVSDSSSD